MGSRPYFCRTVFYSEVVEKDIRDYKHGWPGNVLFGKNMAAVAVDILLFAAWERSITAVRQAAKKMLAEEALESLENY